MGCHTITKRNETISENKYKKRMENPMLIRTATPTQVELLNPTQLIVALDLSFPLRSSKVSKFMNVEFRPYDTESEEAYYIRLTSMLQFKSAFDLWSLKLTNREIVLVAEDKPFNFKDIVAKYFAAIKGYHFEPITEMPSTIPSSF